MAWYYITYKCGHSDKVQIVGPTKNRQWIADSKAARLCSNCYKEKVEADRAAESDRAAAAAKEQELPELHGTIKQVQYGETCRQSLLNKLNANISRLVANIEAGRISESKMPLAKETLSRYSVVLTYICQYKTKASWWIENDKAHTNYLDIDSFVSRMQEEIAAHPDKPEPTKTPHVIRPKTAVSESIATVTVNGNVVEAIFEVADDAFIEIVKSLKMKWIERCWARKISTINGSPLDRAAEVGHHLLSNGFIISVLDDALRDKIITCDYAPEITNWILGCTSGAYKGWFCISWDRNDDYYNVARKLPGSKYAKSKVYVPPHQFEQVLDFADMYGFKLSDKAQEIVKKARADKEAQIVAELPVPERKEPVVIEGRPPKLEVPTVNDIDEEFKDY